MKNKTIITLSLILSLLLHTGCSDSGEDNLPLTNANVLSESSVLSGQTPSLAENQIMILSLESPGSAAPSSDTSEIGVDCFTIKTTQDISNAIISFDENLSVSHAVITHKASGDASTIDKNDVNKTHAFQSGEEYEYCVHHSGATSDEELFFVRFELPQESMIRASDANVSTLKSTKKCIGCDFSNYDFKSSSVMSLVGVNLASANLSNATFGSINLDGANFTAANLSGTSNNMTGNSMVGTIFDNATVDSGFLNVIFPENINQASFANLDLSKTDFTQINLGGTHKAAFEGVNFKGTNLTAANFSQASFQNCTFDYAILENVDFSDAIFTGISTFNYANLNNASIAGANFGTSNMTGTIKNVSGASFASVTDNAPHASNRYNDMVFWWYDENQAKAIPNIFWDNDFADISTNFKNLIWEDDQHALSGVGSYAEAVSYCENLELGGFSDWRVPNYYELTSLLIFTPNGYPQIALPFENLAWDYSYYLTCTNYDNISAMCEDKDSSANLAMMSFSGYSDYENDENSPDASVSEKLNASMIPTWNATQPSYALRCVHDGW